MRVTDAAARAVIQHFVVHDGEVGDVVWPLPESRFAVDLWLEAARDAVDTCQVGASEAADALGQVFDLPAGDARPRFVIVEGIDPTDPEFGALVAVATAGAAQPVLLLEGPPDHAVAAAMGEAGWRLTDARDLLPDGQRGRGGAQTVSTSGAGLPSGSRRA